MKRLFAAMLVLAMVFSCAAAERIGDRVRVVKCNEWITLREDPSTKADSLAQMPLHADELILLDYDFDDFAQISYKGETGYALKKYLETVEEFEGTELDLTEDQRYNVNLFLSNFSEQYFAMDDGFYSYESAEPGEIVDFAINHTWFNKQNLIEWGEWGEDNVRLSSNKIAVTSKKYLNLPAKKGASETFRLEGNHYYWCETGGHIKDGFVCYDSVEELDGGRLSVYFHVYGGGEDWRNKVCYLTAEEAQQEYWCDAQGHAVINMNGSDLDDRSGWYLERYTITRADDTED